MSNSLPIREAFSHYTLSRNFRNCHRIFTIQSSFWKHSILIFYTIMVKKKIIIMTLLADLVCRIFFFLESEMFPYNFCKINMGGGGQNDASKFHHLLLHFSRHSDHIASSFPLTTLANSCLHLFFSKMMKDPSGTNMANMKIFKYIARVIICPENECIYLRTMVTLN